MLYSEFITFARFFASSRCSELATVFTFNETVKRKGDEFRQGTAEWWKTKDGPFFSPRSIHFAQA